MSELIAENIRMVTIGGVEYQLKKLTVKDVFSFSKLMNRTLSNVDLTALAGNEEVTEQLVFQTFMEGFIDSGEKFTEFYGSLIGLDVDQFMELDPSALPDLMEELPKHPDMQSFFAQTARYLAGMGLLWKTV